jgi:LmbE family N-acetylglucosaminyl deacetylase
VTTLDRRVPGHVLAVGAHPDDIEFGCGATLAKWSDAGAHVTMCICTDGSKGTWDANADTRALVEVRKAEQRAAAKVLGVAEVHFLGRVDGLLDHGVAAQAQVSAVIRQTRPGVVFGHDPWATGRIHPDHRHAGLLLLDAIVAARDPHFFVEQLRDEGLTPHRPSRVLLFESEQPDHVERVDAWMDRKSDALLRHRSQWRSTMGIDDRPEEQQAAFVQRLHHEAQAQGLRAGVRRGEAFRTIRNL